MMKMIEIQPTRVGVAFWSEKSGLRTYEVKIYKTEFGFEVFEEFGHNHWLEDWGHYDLAFSAKLFAQLNKLSNNQNFDNGRLFAWLVGKHCR